MREDISTKVERYFQHCLEVEDDWITILRLRHLLEEREGLEYWRRGTWWEVTKKLEEMLEKGDLSEDHQQQLARHLAETKDPGDHLNP